MTNIAEDSPTITENIMQNNSIKDATNLKNFKKTQSTKNIFKVGKQDLNSSINKGKVTKGPTRMTVTGSQKVMES